MPKKILGGAELFATASEGQDPAGAASLEYEPAAGKWVNLILCFGARSASKGIVAVFEGQPSGRYLTPEKSLFIFMLSPLTSRQKSAH